MANITLSWRNRTDASTLASGSWLSTLPLNNIKNRQVQKVARSSDATLTSTKFTVDLGSAKTIGVVALIVHNISVDGTCRIRGNSITDMTTPAYDSGWVDVWPNGIIPQDLLEWEDDNFWLGTMSQEDRAGYNAPYINLMASQQSLRYWLIEIDDTTNADGYVQIGRLFMGATWTPEYNYEQGSAGLGYSDPTTVEKSLSEAEYFDVRSRSRVFGFNLKFLSSAEAYSYVLELQRLAGTSGEVLCIPDSEDTDYLVKRSFVGRMISMSKISIPTLSSHPHTVDIELKELL